MPTDGVQFEPCRRADVSLTTNPGTDLCVCTLWQLLFDMFDDDDGGRIDLDLELELDDDEPSTSMLEIKP